MREPEDAKKSAQERRKEIDERRKRLIKIETYGRKRPKNAEEPPADEEKPR